MRTEAGYSGGVTDDPTYEEVCTNKTGHAEVVQIEFDPDVITYETLVRFFFDNHNPTTLNKQGMDIGTQYRSVIFCHDEEQKQTAERIKKELDESPKYFDPIVTEILDAGRFYPAEEYHQNYYVKKGANTCGF